MKFTVLTTPILIFVLAFWMLTSCSTPASQTEMNQETTTTNPVDDENVPAATTYTLDDLQGSWRLSEEGVYTFSGADYTYLANGVERMKQKVKMVNNCTDPTQVAASTYFLLYTDVENAGSTCYEIKSIQGNTLTLEYHQENSSTIMQLIRMQ